MDEHVSAERPNIKQFPVSCRKMHSGMKTYGCELCGKSFLDSLRLRMHLLSHSGTHSTPIPDASARVLDSRALSRSLKFPGWHTGRKSQFYNNNKSSEQQPIMGLILVSVNVVDV